MSSSHVAVVRKTLQEYADRGVFGSFNEDNSKPANTKFHFVWLHDRRYTIVFDGTKNTLTFKDCFPHVPGNSDINQGIRDFLNERTDKKLRAHRRIDPGRAVVSSSNRGGSVSLKMEIKRNQYAYGTRKFVNLLHETFVMLDQCFTEYLYEHFDLPEE